MRALTKWRAYLPQILGVAAIVVGIGVLVGGLLTLADAQSGRENAEDAEQTSEESLSAARQDLSLAETDLATANEMAADAMADLEDGEQRSAAASRYLRTLQQGMADLESEVAEAFSIAARSYPVVRALADQRASQVEALLADEYTTLTALRLESVELIQELIGNVEALSTQMEDLPTIPMNDPYTYSGRTIDARMPADPVPLDPPTGPAVLTVELPELIGCVPWGSDGCKYSWTARFAESNWLDVAINQVSVRYRSPSRSSYCYFTPDWVDVEIDVPAGGSDTWSRSFWVDRDSKCRPVLGGSLWLRWRGVDAEGHNLSGDLGAPLESPS